MTKVMGVLVLLCGILLWSKGYAQELPQNISKEVKNASEIPTAKWIFIETYEVVGPNFGHNCGHKESDAGAGKGEAWVVKTDVDTGEQHMIFGPYVEPEPGEYIAFFRIKSLGGEDIEEEICVTLDACVGYGQTILITKEVIGNDLSKNKYVQVPLLFQYPGGKLECRVFWPGFAPLAVDSISLFKVEKVKGVAVKREGPVAIFSEFGFPYYMVSSSVTPELVRKSLQGIGINAQSLNAEELSDPGIFNVKNFSVLVYPYGNSFPQDALENLIAWHKDGGCFIGPGVPFCHPCVKKSGKWEDLGHIIKFSHDEMGTGGFYEPPKEGIELNYNKNADPLNFDITKYVDKKKWSQTFDPRSVPEEDEVKGIIGYELPAGFCPIIAIIKHKCSNFKGAIDVWAGTSFFGDASQQNFILSTELYQRAVAYVLKEKKILPEEKFKQIISREIALGKEIKDLPYISEKKSFPGIFPKSALPAKMLIVLDIRKVSSDWKLLLFSLQGIVNRKQPRIYYLYNPTDERWLDWLKEAKYIDDVKYLQKPEELLDMFKADIKGVVITDSKMPVTKNIATMIAGVKDALPVSSRLAKKLNLPVVMDLRGKWEKDVDAYRWAFDNLWKDMNHHVLACSWPDHLGLRDYLVENKVFIFWLSGDIDGGKPSASPMGEVALMEELFSKMPVNIPIMSYPWAGKGYGIGEGPGVTLFAKFAKYLVGSINCSNLSVHTGFTPREFKQIKAPEPPTLQNDKIYFSFIISDGDNIPVLTVGNFPQYLDDPARGRFPMGWTISPSAHELIPAVADYYYKKSTTNDYWMAAVSGIGYTYADCYAERFKDRDKIYTEFLEQTREYMKKMDLQQIWPMNVTQKKLISRYAEVITELTGIFPDYGRRISNYESLNYTVARNVPVFHAVGQWQEGISEEKQIQNIVSEIKSFTPAEKPAFMHVFVLNWFAVPSTLEKILKKLGPDYVCVRPDHLVLLYKEAVQKGLVVSGKERPLKFESLPKEILKEVKDQNEIPRGDYAKVKVYEAETLSHQSGKDENDPQAGNKISWLVRPEKDKPGAIIHGPYAEWDAGKYLIIYRLKLLEDASGKVATVDSCVGGGTPLLGSREVNAEELEVGKYVSIPLLIEHPGGQIETRISWDGNAPLAVDSITLFKIK